MPQEPADTESHQSKKAALKRLTRSGIPVECVVDVGVRERTAELINAFPEKRHFLFEPMREFIPVIEANYRDVDYVLFQLALSDENTTLSLVTTSLNRDGKTTHSQIVDKPREIDGLRVTGCEDIEVRRFDELKIEVDSDFLLKVDVDGKDLQVLRGFGEELRRASAVIVEVTALTAAERLSYLQQFDFRIIDIVDIVDIVYYGNSIHQFDAVFVRNNLMNEELAPGFDPFKPDLWRSPAS